MKKIIVAALLAFTPLAYAEKWVEAGNKAGGKIILLQTPCKHMPLWHVVINSTPNQPTLVGCWAYIAGEVHVKYEDGDLRSYDLDLFRFMDSEKP